MKEKIRYEHTGEKHTLQWDITNDKIARLGKIDMRCELRAFTVSYFIIECDLLKNLVEIQCPAYKTDG